MDKDQTVVLTCLFHLVDANKMAAKQLLTEQHQKEEEVEKNMFFKYQILEVYIGASPGPDF